MSTPELKTEAGTLFDYDLNIYHTEELNADGEYEYTDQWYVDIYEYTNTDGRSNQEHVTGPFKISHKQAYLLELNDEDKWDDDSWYGMWGFMADYNEKLLPELLDTLDALPKYKEEVLF